MFGNIGVVREGEDRASLISLFADGLAPRFLCEALFFNPSPMRGLAPSPSVPGYYLLGIGSLFNQGTMEIIRQRIKINR